MVPTSSPANPAYPYPDGLVYPAIHLFSVDDSFFPKQIPLSFPEQNMVSPRIRIGRQTNNKTAPLPTNGYFDSKVLSRMHAEIWLDQGQVRFFPHACRSLVLSLIFALRSQPKLVFIIDYDIN